MTPEEKAEELYIKFDMIIYTSFNHYEQVFSCMDVAIDLMINNHYFDKNDSKLIFWEKVKEAKEKMMDNKLNK